MEDMGRTSPTAIPAASAARSALTGFPLRTRAAFSAWTGAQVTAVMAILASWQTPSLEPRVMVAATLVMLKSMEPRKLSLRKALPERGEGGGR